LLVRSAPVTRRRSVLLEVGGHKGRAGALRRGEPGPWLSHSPPPLWLRCSALAVEQDVERVAVGDVVVAPLAVYVVDVAVLHHDYVAARATI
jgi:hypothetical protein